MLLLMLSLIPAAQAEGCDVRDSALDEFENAVIEYRLADAETALGTLDGSLVCGDVMKPRQIARMWLAEAVLLQLLGEKEDATIAFAAVSRVDNEYWNADFGPEMRRLYDTAWKAEVGRGIIVLEPEPTGYIATLNGVPASFPAELPEGLHMVQAGETLRTITFARIVHVKRGGTAHLETDIKQHVANKPPAGAEAPAKPPKPPKEASDGGLRLHAALGSVMILGSKLADKDIYGFAEPAAKLNIPLELGAGLVTDSVWMRGALLASPLLGGQYLWQKSDGTAGTSGVGLGGHAGAGLVMDDLEFGLLVGGQFPGRMGVHGAGSLGLGDMLRMEGRLGLNIGTGGRVEGVLGAMLTVSPTL